MSEGEVLFKADETDREWSRVARYHNWGMTALEYSGCISYGGKQKLGGKNLYLKCLIDSFFCKFVLDCVMCMFHLTDRTATYQSAAK